MGEMREIKFRAWDTTRKKMFSAYEMGRDELQLIPDGRGFANVSSLSPKLTQWLTNLIPLQYTGLDDKNGVEIYEGDILSPRDGLEGEGNQVVSWVSEPSCAGFVMTTGLMFDECKEVIGNIYENKELLEDN